MPDLPERLEAEARIPRTRTAPGIEQLDPSFLIQRVNWDLCQSSQEVEAQIYTASRTVEEMGRFRQFWEKSRQIFAFDPGLSSLLSKTQIDDVPWAELRLPHHEFYLGWGDFGQTAFVIRDAEYIIDGAYVLSLADTSLRELVGGLSIVFSARLVHPSYQTMLARMEYGSLYAEPVHNLFLAPPPEGGTIGDAIALGLNSALQLADQQDDSLNQLARILARDVANLPDRPTVAAVHGRTERAWERCEGFYPLLLNALFYLTQFPPDGEASYAPDAPRGLIQTSLNDKNPKRRARAEVELAKRGFSKIKFIAAPDTPSIAAREPGVGLKATTAAHWRRGHWRRQPVGPGLSQRDSE